MARFAVALLFSALLVAGASASARSLLQSTSAGMKTCAEATLLGTPAKNMCCELCYCVGNQSAGKMFASAPIQNLCKQKCNECVADVAACAPGDALPESCAKGLQFTPAVTALVDKCQAMYAAEPASIARTGC